MDKELKRIRELTTFTFKEMYEFSDRFKSLKIQLMTCTDFVNFLRSSRTVLNRFDRNSTFMNNFYKMFASTKGYISRFDFLLAMAILRNKAPFYPLEEFLTDFLHIQDIFEGLDDTYVLCKTNNSDINIADFKTYVKEKNFKILFMFFYIEVI